MALQNLNLATITSPIIPNPGIAGWDAGLSQFMKERSGRMQFGLVTRLDPFTPDNDSDGTVAITCPPGFQCIPMLVLAFLRGGTVASPQYYEFFRVSKTAANMWAGLNAGGGANYISFAKLTLTEPLVIWARPDSSLFTDLAPEGIPMLDGDDNLLNTLNIRRQAGNSLSIGLHFYGCAWPKSDV